MASPASAQLTESQAEKALNAEIREVLKAFQIGLKQEKAQVLLAAKIFEVEIKNDNSLGVVESLYHGLQDFQEGVGSLVQQSGADAADAASQVLAARAFGQGPLDGIYPRGFYPGDGGVFDRFLAKVRAAHAKTIAAAVRKLGKLPELVERKANVGMTLALGPWAFPLVINWDENGTLGSLLALAPTIDTFVAVSQLGTAGDGVVFVGGAGDVGAAAVTVDLVGPESPSVSGIMVSEGFRWWTMIDDGGTGLAEGVYAARARHGIDPPQGDLLIGVR
jgi:hypothetical protein